MREMQDAIIENLAHYIMGATDAEFNLEQCRRMVRLTFQAYKSFNIAVKEMTGE